MTEPGGSAETPLENQICKRIILAWFIGVVLLHSGGSRATDGFECGYCTPMEIDRLAALLGDEVLRDMVCRLAYQTYTPQTLSTALGLPPDRLMGRFETLRRWGVVRMVSIDPSRTLVEPLPGDGARTLQRWAHRYCPLGDECGELKPDELRPKSGKGLPMRLGDGIPLPRAGGDERTRRFFQTMVRIDAINLGDPARITHHDEDWAREVFISRRRSHWLYQLAPNASDLVRIAARAQHIARWEIPRASYPTGRLGYHNWRNALAKFHAEKIGEILAEMGYTNEEIARTKDLVQKKNFKLDPETQLLEDVSSIVFFEYEFTEFAAAQTDEKLLNIIRKTWQKMSDQGRQAVRRLDLPLKTRELVQTALRDQRGVNY